MKSRKRSNVRGGELNPRGGPSRRQFQIAKANYSSSISSTTFTYAESSNPSSAMIPPAGRRLTIKSFSGLRTKQLEDVSCSQRNLAKEAKLSEAGTAGEIQHHDIIDICFAARCCTASASCQTQSHNILNGRRHHMPRG